MPDTRKPAIVTMVADNTGYGDLGCNGPSRSLVKSGGVAARGDRDTGQQTP